MKNGQLLVKPNAKRTTFFFVTLKPVAKTCPGEVGFAKPDCYAYLMCTVGLSNFATRQGGKPGLAKSISSDGLLSYL